MATGFRVRYRSMDQSIQGERLLFQLPIRIGRNPLNHCQVVHGYISDFHAVIEANEMGQLFVRDLNSKNGIFTPSGERFARNVPAPLSPINNTFILGGLLTIQVEVVEQDRAARRAHVGHERIRHRKPRCARGGLGAAARGWRRVARRRGILATKSAPLPPLSGGDGSPRAARPPLGPGAPERSLGSRRSGRAAPWSRPAGPGSGAGRGRTGRSAHALPFRTRERPAERRSKHAALLDGNRDDGPPRSSRARGLALAGGPASDDGRCRAVVDEAPRHGRGLLPMFRPPARRIYPVHLPDGPPPRGVAAWPQSVGQRAPGRSGAGSGDGRRRRSSTGATRTMTPRAWSRGSSPIS